MITILVLCLVLSSPEDQDAFRVFVSDSTSESPVTGAMVFLNGEYAGTTDSTGSLMLYPSNFDTSLISIVRTGYHHADTMRFRESVLSIVITPDPETMPSIQSEHIREPPGEWSYSVRKAEIQEYETIEARLDDIPGVRVEESSSDIGLGGVSLRGSPSSHTAVWIDGIPVSDSKFGTSRTEGLLPGIVERLEVYQGWTPSRLGGTSLGGGIELHTKENIQEGMRFSGGYGSYGRFSCGAGAGFRRNSLSTWLDIQWLKHKNDFRYVDDNATPINTDDDTTRVRTNSAIEAVNLLTKISLDASPSIRLNLISLGTWRWEGIPGPGANPIIDATHRSRDERIILNVTRTESSSNIKLTSYHELYSSTVRDPSAELAHYVSNRKESGTNSGLRCFLRYDNHRFWAADGRLEAQFEKFESLIRTTSTTRVEESRTTFEFGTGLDLRPLDYLRVRGEAVRSVQNDSHNGSDKNQRFAHGFRALIEMNPGYGVKINGSYSDRSRIPTLSELYGNRGSVRGNDSLVPEKGRQIEFGIKVRETVTMVAYLREVDDLIFYWLRSPRIIIPENIGRSRMQGVEISAMHVLEDLRMLTLRFSAVHQRTEDRSRIPYYRGNALPGNPQTICGGTLSFNAVKDMHVGLGVRYESEFFIDRANRREEGSRINTRTWLTLGNIDSIRFAFHVDDVFDEAGNNQWGYPMPGRRFRVQVSTFF